MPVLGAPRPPAPDGQTPYVMQVHGCHRYAQDGVRGWHRHVGPRCRWIPARRARQNPYARCRTRCEYVGPIKECWRDCR